MNGDRFRGRSRTISDLSIQRRAVLAVLAWAGAIPADWDAALAGKRARRRKRRRRRARERLCQAICGGSCATCRQRCAVCNEFQICFHLADSTQPRCEIGVIPDDCELCGADANCDAGSFCVTGFTSTNGDTRKIAECTYARGVCMEELP
jgi:hypothetical protein